MPSRSLSIRYDSHSFAACWFLENFHTIQTFGAATLTRLPGSPWGLEPEEGVLEHRRIGVLGRPVGRDRVVDPARDTRGQVAIVGRVVPGADLRGHALLE